MDSRHYGEYIIRVAVLFATDIAITHEGDLLALQVVDAMEHKAFGCNLRQHYISHPEPFGANERYAVHAALYIRPHAHTCRRELHLPAFGYKAGYLRDEYLVGQLHENIYDLRFTIFYLLFTIYDL